jgi:hypothetical protein
MPTTRAGAKRGKVDRSPSPNEHKVIKKTQPKNGAPKKSTKLSQQPQEDAVNIVEKGIIYFFTRGRVDIEDPKDVSELQRTYFVLRPMTKMSKKELPDDSVCRLIALPKKTFPKHPQDRYMAFVEKSKASLKDLKAVLVGTTYETKTKGTRTTPPMLPIGEGVYAITNTGKSSHLAYILAIPQKPGELQRDLGISEKGSFIVSLKSPDVGGPPGTQLPKKPEMPKEIADEFDGKRWIPIQKSQHLDYPNSQILLLGEAQGEFKGAFPKGAEHEQERLERFDEEEHERLGNLKGKHWISHFSMAVSIANSLKAMILYLPTYASANRTILCSPLGSVS